MVCGIYKIENSDNGKIYVGSSKDVEKRWGRHRADLSRGSHHSAKLQHAWNKNNKHLPLTFHLLEECAECELLTREQFWMDELKSYANGYNCSKMAAYPTSKIKTSLKVKYEYELNEIARLLYEWSQMKHVFPKDILVSFFGTGVEKCSTDSAFIKRYLKALKMCIRITENGQHINSESEYRLHYIHYSGKEAEYELTEEDNSSKKAKWSLHSKKKAPDLHAQLWEDMYTSLEGRLGKEIKSRYETYMKSEEVPGCGL